MAISPHLRDLSDTRFGDAYTLKSRRLHRKCHQRRANIPVYRRPVVLMNFTNLRASPAFWTERKSLFHALNIRHIARLMAISLAKHLETNLIGVQWGRNQLLRSKTAE